MMSLFNAEILGQKHMVSLNQFYFLDGYQIPKFNDSWLYSNLTN